ncbi:LEM3/CDC50 family protein, putative [Plasmodium gallinaceum]|uniref:LEM3/CDC50 family protein, putative n=1 Tax=Plasmodium gallinaceum TaxID=5849 RepID=A0A1J1GYL1_PLAGA|nr:LEM3/CDC50 family protein, putative [Plasmodium gallinaceum]CRG96384.1 LEM3/CDC50 family protein, putative [Plasmodium gallinaceum]
MKILKRKNENIKKKKRDLYYKKTSKFVRFLYKFIKWYRMEAEVGPIRAYKYSSVILFLIFLFIFNMIIGIIVLLLSNQYIECRIPYEYKGQSYTKYSIVRVTPEHCKGIGNLKELKGKLNVHYELQGLQQNHYRFVSSFKKEQLSGQIFLKKEDVSECHPFITFSEGGVNKILHPCGIFPWNVFSDSYIFYDREPDEFPFPTPIPIQQKVEDITIKYYRKFFKNPSAELINSHKDHVYFWMDEKLQSKSLQENKETNEKLVILPQTLKYDQAGKAIENSHFINWMIPSALNYIKRLYAKIDGPLVFPFYIYIENRLKISDTKIVVISNSTIYPGITLIGFIFIVVSLFAFILSILYIIRMRKYQFT